MAESIPRWSSLSANNHHLPRAVRRAGYFDTRPLGTAAIISSGPWHRALAQPSQQGIQTASPGVDTLVHLQVGRELLSSVASRFPCIIISAIPHPYRPSPIRNLTLPCSLNTRHKSRTRRRLGALCPCRLRLTPSHSLRLCSHSAQRLV